MVRLHYWVFVKLTHLSLSFQQSSSLSPAHTHTHTHRYKTKFKQEIKNRQTKCKLWAYLLVPMRTQITLVSLIVVETHKIWSEKKWKTFTNMWMCHETIIELVFFWSIIKLVLGFKRDSNKVINRQCALMYTHTHTYICIYIFMFHVFWHWTSNMVYKRDFWWLLLPFQGVRRKKRRTICQSVLCEVVQKQKEQLQQQSLKP